MPNLITMELLYSPSSSIKQEFGFKNIFSLRKRQLSYELSPVWEKLTKKEIVKTIYFSQITTKSTNPLQGTYNFSFYTPLSLTKNRKSNIIKIKIN